MTAEKFDPEELYGEASELASTGHHSDAVSLFNRLVAATADARFHIAYARCLQELGHWEESIIQFRAGINLKPHYCEGDARLMLAESFMKIGQKLKAIDEWRIVAAMPPEYPSYEAVPNEAKENLSKHAA
jgi:tetratricopeptide (TPR) repeat protein